MNPLHFILKFRHLKKLFINFSFRSFTNLISKFIGLVTLPIIARALGPEAYGNYNLVLITVQYTSFPISLLGLRSYGIREIAGRRKDDSYAIDILSMQLSIALISVFVSTLITFFLFKSSLLLFFSILIGYIIVFTNALNLEFFYVAKKDLLFPSIARLVGQICYVLGVIFFIKEPEDYPFLVFFAALTPAIADFIQLKRFHKRSGKVIFRLHFKDIINTFRTTYRLGISTNLEGLIPLVPQLLIPVILSTYALGIFSGGYKVYSILVTFYITFYYALAPYLVGLNKYHIDIRRKYHFLVLLIVMFVSILIGVMLFFWGEPIVVLILGKDFGESIVVFKAISLTLIPLTPISMLIGNILIYSSREKYYLISLIISGLTILLSSPILIKNFNEVGAIYSIAISMISGILTMTYFYFRSERSVR